MTTPHISCLDSALHCEAKFLCATFFGCNVSGDEYISCDESDDIALPSGSPGHFFIAIEHIDLGIREALWPRRIGYPKPYIATN